ncbi:hypothetical protein SOM61_23645 [Massilia sp. CFBP9012]|nr:hypothetical protein [Massilia sp. CFBP9012]
MIASSEIKISLTIAYAKSHCGELVWRRAVGKTASAGKLLNNLTLTLIDS